MNRHLRTLAAAITLCLVVSVAAVVNWDDSHGHRLAVRSEGPTDSGSVIDIAPGPDATTTVPGVTSTSSPSSSSGSGSSGKSAGTGSPTATGKQPTGVTARPADDLGGPPAPPSDPRVQLFPTSPYSRPINIAVIGEDLWFNSIQGFLGRVTPSGAMTEFKTPGDSPDHIAAGPDGNSWFTDSANRKVGYVTPAGGVTTLPVALAGAVEFSDITAGSDGAMWFTVGGGPEFGLGVLGRVTTGGDVTLRPLGEMTLTGLTRAPDGSLWVLDLAKVHHVGVDGSVASFAAPGGWWMIGKPAIGPDGNLWMLGETSPASKESLFRLTTDGVFTPIALPSGWMDASRIAAGPDHNLWVVAESRRSISRMTPQGTIIEEIDVSDRPWDITAGPDGRMWFTAMTSIGRIAV